MSGARGRWATNSRGNEQIAARAASGIGFVEIAARRRIVIMGARDDTPSPSPRRHRAPPLDREIDVGRLPGQVESEIGVEKRVHQCPCP